MLKSYAQACCDLLFPRSCHICSRLLCGATARFDDHLCADCFASMKRCNAISCRWCGSPLTEEREKEEFFCRRCRNDKPAYHRLMTCYAYEGPVRLLIHKMKYEGRAYLASTIARLIAAALPDKWLDLFDALVPVPLHAARAREREFNQAEAIARHLAGTTSLSVIPALQRSKNTPALADLKKQGRMRVLNHAFRLDEKCSSLMSRRRILLVDDIVTTTATARQASRLLMDEGGCCQVTVLAFAKS
ncbi:MAG: ComF family protein [Candidatus Velamenicoccus archaeovorus]